MFADLLKQQPHHHHVVDDANDNEAEYERAMIMISSYESDNNNDDVDDPPSESYHSRIHRGLGLYSRRTLRSGETQGRPAINLVQNVYSCIYIYIDMTASKKMS